MAFMEPYTYCGPYYHVDTLLECFIVPADVAGPNASADELSQYAPECVSPDAFDQIEDWKVELRTGWYGRYSADGYLDCTDWEAADTEEELRASLRDMYGDDDDDSADDESEGEPNYQVVVGNIGTVYDGPSLNEAEDSYSVYVGHSTMSQGHRCYGEPVSLLRTDPGAGDQDIVKEYPGRDSEDDAS